MEITKAISLLHVGKLITADRDCLCVVQSLSSREASVRASLPLTTGQSVTLGLRNGFTVPSVVGIIMEDQVSLLFEEHVSISTILAEQRSGRSERDAVRLAVTLPVSIITPTGNQNCTMQDISLSGIRVLDEALLLTEGMEVQIMIDGIGKRDATVRWRHHPYVGLSFHVPLGFRLLDQWSIAVNGRGQT